MIYGCNVWGLSTEDNIYKIEVLQKKCIRIMTFSDFNAHTHDIFKDLKIIKVKDVIKMQQLKIVYDFLNNSLPSDLMSLFIRSSDIHPNFELNSSINNLLYIPRISTTTYGIKSIRYHCAKLWNDTFKNGNLQVKNLQEKKTVTSG